MHKMNAVEPFSTDSALGSGDGDHFSPDLNGRKNGQKFYARENYVTSFHFSCKCANYPFHALLTHIDDR